MEAVLHREWSLHVVTFTQLITQLKSGRVGLFRLFILFNFQHSDCEAGELIPGQDDVQEGICGAGKM